MASLEHPIIHLYIHIILSLTPSLLSFVSGLVLRQVHHHHRLLTLVYVGEAADDLSVDGLLLRDCRLAGDAGEVAEFMEQFEEDAAAARTSAAGKQRRGVTGVVELGVKQVWRG